MFCIFILSKCHSVDTGYIAIVYNVIVWEIVRFLYKAVSLNCLDDNFYWNNHTSQKVKDRETLEQEDWDRVFLLPVVVEEDCRVEDC